MSHWNHRVIEFPPDPGDDEPVLIICEVFYNSDGSLSGHNGGAKIMGHNTNDLWQQMEFMRRSLAQPFLKASDFPTEKAVI